MSAVAVKIKRLRTNNGLTQEQMADRVHLSLGAWQKVENGITKIDIDRLKQIAEILETTVEDLINVEDSVYINEIKDNDVGFNNSAVTINHRSELETELYEKLIVEKDKVIADKTKEIEFLRGLLEAKNSG